MFLCANFSHAMAKKEAVQGIFNRIAPCYDRLNHLFSLNIDKGWRRKALRQLEEKDKTLLLDVACGTADFSLAAIKVGVRRVIGTDISEKMLEIGRQKVIQAGLEEKIQLEYGDCEQMRFADNTFNAVTVAFGIRNFERPEKGLAEMYRVLKPGGKVVILEFSTPRRFPMRQLYHFYFHHVMSTVGGWLSGDKGAFNYFPASVAQFPQGIHFVRMMNECGFVHISQKRLTCGIATLYVGVK